MKISYNWLKEYLDFDIPAEELAVILTNTGLEVEGMESWTSLKGGLEGILIGKVLTCEKHPDADRLSVTTVDVGRGEPLHIVCGAPNVAAGQTVPVALVGATVYKGDESLQIRKSKIRGQLSEGMICAEDELGLGESHEGIMVLDDALPAGSAAADYFKIETDTVYEIGLTPNRIDGGSHYGVARDLAAWMQHKGMKRQAMLPSIDHFAADNEQLKIEIQIENERACNRYAGLTLSALEVKESPDWLKNRLRAIGLEPINNVVDATNYVLFECGQPLHAFDADKIRGQKIVVRNPEEGSAFVTLDGKERKLSAKDLMICNAEEGMCIAGVFGGEESGVTESSRNIFLESAYFDPVSVRKTAKRHGLNTDASFRFERGVDPDLIPWALQRAALLIKELAGGTISSHVTDLYPSPVPNHIVTLSYAHVHRLIGKELEKKQIQQILLSLDILLLEENEDTLLLEVPAYRVDVTREADVIEEILRIHGYNEVEIPEKMSSTLSYRPKPDQEVLLNKACECLTDNGFREIMNNSLSPETWYTGHPAFDTKELAYIQNPLSNDLNVMRISLLQGGLHTIAYNINRQQNDLRLYEYGKVYRKNKQADPSRPISAYQEKAVLALFLSGNEEAENWIRPLRESDLFLLRSYIEKVMVRCGLDVSKLKVVTVETDLLGLCVSYELENRHIALTGQVRAEDLKKFDLKQPVIYGEIYWDEILRLNGQLQIQYRELPKYPAVRRDLALLLDTPVAYAELKELAFKTEKHLLKEVNLFDVYESEKLGQNKKSYALSFILQDEKKTLTDKQVDKVMKRLFQAFERAFHAQLR